MRNKTHQDKTYLFLFTALVLTFAILYFAAQHLIVNEFVVLENRQNSKNVTKLIEKISNTLLDLKKTVTDYAQWDDTYGFIIDHNSAYIESNFPEDGETLNNLGIDFFLMTDLKKQHLFINTNQRQQEEAKRIFEKNIRELIRPEKESFSGLIKSEGSYWFVVIEAILHSDETGPSIGYLIGAKEFNMAFVHSASQGLFDQVAFEDPILRKEKMPFIKNEAGLKVQHLMFEEEKSLVNKLLFYDLKGQQIFSLFMRNARSIYLQGKETTQYFILLIFVLSIPLVYLYMKYQELLKKSLRKQLANEIEKNRHKDYLIKIKERLSQAQHIAHIGNFEFDLCENNVWISDEVYNILKVDRQMKISRLKAFVRLIHPEDRRLFFNTFRKSISEHLNFNFSYRLNPLGGNVRIVQQIGNVVYDKSGQTPLKVLGTLQDITEKRQYEEMIHSLAYYDPLTRLPNRTLFKERLQKALSRAARIKSKLAVMYLDMDNFKIINDSMGHDIGDKTLQKLSKKIGNCIRTEDTLSRIGGDEFIILLEDIKDQQEAVLTAQRIQESCSTPLFIEGKEIYASFSVGISIYPDNGTDMQTLIQNADSAMYHVKSNEKDNFHIFSEELSFKNMNRVQMEGALHHAIEKNELYLLYQPKVDIHTQKVYGMEALVRWNSEIFGRVRPDVFIPIAEECGMISKIGEWVLKTALLQNEKWHKQGHKLVVSVNVSGNQLRHDEFYERIMKIINSVSLDNAYLELEITESILMHNIHDSLRKLNLLKDRGVLLAIDDFGTGYSSMNYLKRFPINTLKIDKSFVNDLSDDNEDKEIVSAIVSLGHALNLQVIAEGVESKKQVELLKELGCDAIQGYFYAQPLDEKQFTAYLEK